MCEIFFQYSPRGSINLETFRELLGVALEASNYNEDGFGVFNERREIYKNCEKFDEKHKNLVYEKFRGSKFVVLHLRSATNGYIRRKDTHPFERKRNIIVHNGILYSDNYSQDRADSYHYLVDITDPKKESSVERIKSVLKETKGSLSIFHYDENNDLYYYREGSDFNFMLIPEKEEIVGATGQNRLKKMFAKERYNFFEGYGKIIKKPEENVIYGITDEGINEVDEFEMADTGKIYYRNSDWEFYDHRYHEDFERFEDYYGDTKTEERWEGSP